MDEITSNRHVGVIVVSLAILALGLMTSLFGGGRDGSSDKLEAPIAKALDSQLPP